MTGLTLTSNADALGADIVEAGHELADTSDVMRVQGQAALAAADIPVRTGHLLDTADVAVTSEGFALTAAATYAGFVHARDPFFTRALAARENDIAAALDEHAEDIINRIGT